MADQVNSTNLSEIAVKYRPIGEIHPCPTAAKIPSRQALRAQKKLVQQTGVTDPVVIDEAATILHGELEYATYLALGFETVPTIQIDWLSEDQKIAYRLASARIPELASWDKPKLKAELERLVEINVELDLSMTGFTVGEIDLVLQHDEPVAGGDEALPLPPDRPVSRPGDIWVLGQHKLLCGSCLEPGAWTSLLGSETARLCLTDPPYNVPIKGHVTSKNHAEFAMASGEMSRAEFEAFLTTGLQNAIDRTSPGGLHLIAMDHAHLGSLLAVCDRLYQQRLNIIVWAKTNAGMGSLYRSAHEFFVLVKVGSAPHVNNVQLGRFGRNRSNLWTYAGANQFRRNRDKDLADHPTVKPVDLVADAILDLTEPGDVVIDGFAGSGTLILAGEQTGRKARAIEIDPRYCDVALARWSAITGNSPVLAASGQTFEETGQQRAEQTEAAFTGEVQ